MKVKKRNGQTEEFRREKLEDSIRRSGASPEVARRVAERVRSREDVSTEELRGEVARLLSEESPELSTSYQSTRRLNARSLSDIAEGVARVNEDLLKRMGGSSGQQAVLMARDRRAEVRIESSEAAPPREILLSRSDIERLGVSDGSRIGMRMQPK